VVHCFLWSWGGKNKTRASINDDVNIMLHPKDGMWVTSICHNIRRQRPRDFTPTVGTDKQGAQLVHDLTIWWACSWVIWKCPGVLVELRMTSYDLYFLWGIHL
jgi:hypothetical protein